MGNNHDYRTVNPKVTLRISHLYFQISCECSNVHAICCYEFSRLLKMSAVELNKNSQRSKFNVSTKKTPKKKSIYTFQQKKNPFFCFSLKKKRFS